MTNKSPLNGAYQLKTSKKNGDAFARLGQAEGEREVLLVSSLVLLLAQLIQLESISFQQKDVLKPDLEDLERKAKPFQWIQAHH